MKRALQNALCVITALYLIGGHWGMLQVVAWSQMLQNYSETSGLLSGFQQTFSGEKPCRMCHRIQEEKDKENKNLPLPSEKTEQLASKWLLLLTTDIIPLPACSEKADEDRIHTVLELSEQWIGSPPSPPPRTLAQA